jgi:hypothetical protein
MESLSNVPLIIQLERQLQTGRILQFLVKTDLVPYLLKCLVNLCPTAYVFLKCL